MALPLNYEIHEKENSLYLCLEGDLDEESFVSVSHALSDRPLVQPVKVDLHKVRYADTTGLRALVLLQSRAKEAGVGFSLVEPSDAVKRVFRATGLAALFNIRLNDSENPCS
jgi:anti-anti-sigma factor